jgi:hypothetical protein
VVLGADGGAGSAELCRPLQAHPVTLGVAPHESLELRVRTVLSTPDQDVTRVHGSVTVAVQGAATAPLPPEASRLAERALAGLLEPLRSLGGQATASTVEVEVRCVVSRL